MSKPVTLLIHTADDALFQSCADIFHKERYLLLRETKTAELLARVKQQPVELLLLSLPACDETGLSMLSPLREQFPDLGLVLMVSEPCLTTALAGLHCYVDGYWAMSSGQERLYTTVQNALSRIAARRNPPRHLLDSLQQHIQTWFSQKPEPHERSSDIMEMGELRINRTTREAWFHQMELHLTPYELEALILLMQRAGKVVGYGEIVQQIQKRDVEPWETQDLARNLIYRLRQKLSHPSASLSIDTIRGQGYRLNC